MDQSITDKSDLKKYRTELPNLYDDADLDPFEFRLLAHYKRVGTCFESTRTTAKKCRMSVGQVSEKRQSLAGQGWIRLSESDHGTIQIEVVDRWAENFAKYSSHSARERSRGEQRRSRGEQRRSRGEQRRSRGEQRRSRGETKKEPLEEKPIKRVGAAAPRRAPAPSHSPSPHFGESVQEGQQQGNEPKDKVGVAPPAFDLSLAERELLTAFVQASGIQWRKPLTKSERMTAELQWIEPARRMVALADGQAPALVTEAVGRLRRDGLTIRSPKSVEATVTSIFGERTVPAPVEDERTRQAQAEIRHFRGPDD